MKVATTGEKDQTFSVWPQEAEASRRAGISNRKKLSHGQSLPKIEWLKLFVVILGLETNNIENVSAISCVLWLAKTKTPSAVK